MNNKSPYEMLSEKEKAEIAKAMAASNPGDNGKINEQMLESAVNAFKDDIVEVVESGMRGTEAASESAK